MNQKQRLDILVDRLASGMATTDELDELRALVDKGLPVQVIYSIEERLARNAVTTADADYSKEKWDPIVQKILRSGQQARQSKNVHRVHFLKTAWFKYAAAVLIIAGVGAYLWSTQQKEKPLITQHQPSPVKTDILPGKDRAILTLSDGKKIELNNATSETITDGTVPIKNSNGQLLYTDAERGSLSPAGGSGAGGAEGGPRTATNTMTTPRGGQYQLTLSDGTRVWLNAASSITYPVTFTGKTREVSITGEAYFEVAADKSKPFRVKTNKDEITVLGTSFNVNAYADEPGKTSLLQGSVRINNKILKPGEAYQNGKIVATNIDQDISWKNGIFNFHAKNVEEVMRQLSRWYNIDVSYESKPPAIVFYGKMGRNLPLSVVLEFLAESGIHFRIENGNKLIVLK